MDSPIYGFFLSIELMVLLCCLLNIAEVKCFCLFGLY